MLRTEQKNSLTPVPFNMTCLAGNLSGAGLTKTEARRSAAGSFSGLKWHAYRRLLSDPIYLSTQSSVLSTGCFEDFRIDDMDGFLTVIKVNELLHHPHAHVIHRLMRERRRMRR